MTNTLQDILATLSSDNARLQLLHKAYTPGNEEVADAILALHTDKKVLEKETSFALKHGQTNRFETLAKQLIDVYVAQELLNKVSDKTIEWKNVELANYALSKIPVEGGPMISREYENAINIATHFNMSEKATELLETRLASTPDSFDRTQILLQLKKYDQILDDYISSPSPGETHQTLNIAEEHVQERVNEIAEIGYTQNKPPQGYEATFVRCSKVIGKEKEAKKLIVAHAKKIDKEKSPFMYKGLVEALVTLNEQDEATKLVETVAAEFKKTDETYQTENSNNLAALYALIGQNDVVETIYKERAKFIVDNNWAIGKIQNEVQEARKLLGPEALLEEELIFHELSGNYTAAAKVATQMGNQEQAANYLVMESMIPNKTE